MIFIGDVHGKYKSYKKIMKKYENTIQVGDMGVGFKRNLYIDGVHINQFFPNPPYDRMVEGNHRFIRGNHDNPSVCKQHSQCINDGYIEDDVMFVGGAVSIDKEWRTEGYDWWPEEELTIPELDVIVDKYCEVKPRIMVTHTAPDFLADSLAWAANRGYKLDIPSRHQQAFNVMFFHHKPELWVFGHWHVDFEYMHEGTRFICLNELSILDIDKNDLLGGEIISFPKFIKDDLVDDEE